MEYLLEAKFDSTSLMCITFSLWLHDVIHLL